MLKKILKSKYSLCFFVFCLCIIFYFVFCFVFLRDNFDIRISIKKENFSPQEMDNIFATNLYNSFLNIKNIKTIYTFSSKDYCNIYIKFFFPYFKPIAKIKISLDDFLSKSKQATEVDFDYDYNKKYDYFLVVFDNDKDDFIDLSNIFLNKIKSSKLTLKTLDLQKFETINYIYFNNSILTTHNTTPTEIKNLIKTNNQEQNSTTKNENFSYEIVVNSDINNISDLKNSALFFQDNNFSDYFKNIFKIKKEILNDDFSVFYDKNKIRIFALQKLNFLPNFLFEFLLKSNLNNDLNYKLINTKNLSKVEILLDENSSTSELLNIQNKISNNFENQIYFLKTDPPKTSFFDSFREIEKNKIVILTNKKRKLENFLMKNNLNYTKQKPKSKKEKIIFYNIDSMYANSYFFNKEEITDSILANNDGLICDYYFDFDTRVKIILKNEEKSDFIYSKKFKNLIDINMFLKKELKEEYTSIIRKNGQII